MWRQRCMDVTAGCTLSVQHALLGPAVMRRKKMKGRMVKPRGQMLTIQIQKQQQGSNSSSIQGLYLLLQITPAAAPAVYSSLWTSCKWASAAQKKSSSKQVNTSLSSSVAAAQAKPTQKSERQLGVHQSLATAVTWMSQCYLHPIQRVRVRMSEDVC